MLMRLNRSLSILGFMCNAKPGLEIEGSSFGKLGSRATFFYADLAKRTMSAAVATHVLQGV